MARKKKIIKVNIDEMIGELLSTPFHSVDFTKVVHRGMIMDNGQNYEIHVTITTNEDEFIED